MPSLSNLFVIVDPNLIFFLIFPGDWHKMMSQFVLVWFVVELASAPYLHVVPLVVKYQSCGYSTVLSGVQKLCAVQLE